MDLFPKKTFVFEVPLHETPKSPPPLPPQKKGVGGYLKNITPK
jgi:hypothetical protein